MLFSCFINTEAQLPHILPSVPTSEMRRFSARLVPWHHRTRSDLSTPGSAPLTSAHTPTSPRYSSVWRDLRQPCYPYPSNSPPSQLTGFTHPVSPARNPKVTLRAHNQPCSGSWHLLLGASQVQPLPGSSSLPWLLWGCSHPHSPRQRLPNWPCDLHSCHPAPLDLVSKGNQNDLGKHKCAWSHTPTPPHLEGQLKHFLKLHWSGQRHPLTSPQASDHTSTSGSLHRLPGAPPPRWGNGHPITALDLDSCDITSETSPQIIHWRAPLLPCDPTPCPVCYLSWFSRSWTLDSALTHLDNINLHCVTEH